MTRFYRGIFCRNLGLLFIFLLFSCAVAQQAFNFSQVVSGLSEPVGVTHAGDGSGRLFITEKAGFIRVVQEGQLLSEPFLDVRDILTPEPATEQGLLGLAFHPDYKSNGTFFIYYTNAQKREDGAADTVLARYQVSSDPNTADPASAKIILTIEQPFWNHNGGHIAFGPDGYLYIGTGDGGDGGDPQENAEDLTDLLGKMLRIDVNAETYVVPESNPWTAESGARTEIWAYGLRNPWKFSFDRKTGDLYIGDVGQEFYEEINVQPASSTGGENYGWNQMEGFQCYGEADCDQSQYTLPVHDYAHGEDGVSVTGGVVYRGAAFPELDGAYLYADFASGKVWSLRFAEGVWVNTLFADTDFAVSSFGEDEAGELYVLDFGGGGLYQLTK
jgi:glucose/arabinose dehydrogenase